MESLLQHLDAYELAKQVQRLQVKAEEGNVAAEVDVEQKSLEFTS